VTGLARSGLEILRDDGTLALARAAVDRVVARPWGERKRSLSLSCGGVAATMDTTTDAATEWFFPRYLFGALHEPALTREWIARIEPESTVVDVGACVGYFASFAAAAGAQVHAFELDGRFVEATRRSLARNGSEATVRQRAVSDETGATVGFSGEVGVTAVGGDRGHVETVALDDAGVAPDIVKIDVEGHEQRVLEGATQMLGEHRPTLFVELHPSMLGDHGSNVGDVLGLLERHGYDAEILDHRTAGGGREPATVAAIERGGNVVLVCESA
jgi:FkbM family methyltransferase